MTDAEWHVRHILHASKGCNSWHGVSIHVIPDNNSRTEGAIHFTFLWWKGCTFVAVLGRAWRLGTPKINDGRRMACSSYPSRIQRMHITSRRLISRCFASYHGSVGVISLFAYANRGIPTLHSCKFICNSWHGVSIHVILDNNSCTEGAIHFTFLWWKGCNR